LCGVARDVVALEDDHHPPRNFTLIAFGFKGVCGSFATIPMHENNGCTSRD
jgi:hypothetical protein